MGARRLLDCKEGDEERRKKQVGICRPFANELDVKELGIKQDVFNTDFQRSKTVAIRV